MSEIWRTRPDLPDTDDMVGYDVQAPDGTVGTIEEASWHADRSHLVVSTGRRRKARHVVVPTGLVDEIDHTTRTVHLAVPTDVVTSSPDDDPEQRALDAPGFWEPYDDHYRLHGSDALA